MDTQNLLQRLEQMIDPERCVVAGVFPRDLLKMSMFQRFPVCCIVNTDPSNKPGQHWVAFYVRSPNDFEFFDSYGINPIFYNFGSEFEHPKTYNSRVIQYHFSNKCGVFCLYYLYCKSLGISMRNVIDSFSHTNLRWNDKLVKKFISQVTNPKAFVHSPIIQSPNSQVSLVKRCVSIF